MSKNVLYAAPGYYVVGYATMDGYPDTGIFDTMVELVLSAIKRPDKKERIKDLIIEGGTYVHRAEEWNRDKARADVVFDIPIGEFSVSIASLPRRRRILQVYPTDGSVIRRYEPLRRTTPTGIPEDVQHFYYELGDTLNGISSLSCNALGIEYLSYPRLGKTNETYRSWIAAEYPDAIVYYALWKLASELALKEAGSFQQQFTMHLRNLQQNYI